MVPDRHLSRSSPQAEIPSQLQSSQLQLIEQQTQADWELFFTLSLDLMCIVGFDGYFKRLNPAWEEVLGFTDAELLSQPFIEFVHPADRAITRVELQRLIAGGSANNFENRYRCKDGSYKWFSWKTLSPTEQLIYAVARDVTLEKQIQATTRESTVAVPRPPAQATTPDEELEEISRLKDEFLSTVSHELRSPITNIKMAIQMLSVVLNQNREPSSKTPLQNSKVVRYFQVLQDECDREIRLINDLLDVQLSDTIPALSLETIYLQTLLLRIVEPFQERTRNRNQTLQLDFPAALPPLVSERLSLERILAELLNNACKYTPPGERIVLKAIAQPGKIQIQVTNSGVEIPANELSRIFDKFYRIPSSDAWKQGGTGLGLALVKKLTERLQGQVWADSASNQTCFTVELPLDNS